MHNDNTEGGTVRLDEAKPIAERLSYLLTPYCDRIEIAGSIRRSNPVVHDIDIVLIPKPEAALTINYALSRIGTITKDGPKIKQLWYTENQSLISVDLYLATPATWATLLLIRTGSKQNNIRLATMAKRRGWQLKANGDGLFDEHNNRVAGDTEQSIYEALGVPYQEPQRRG
jgi:DNA polymerase (family 10)